MFDTFFWICNKNHRLFIRLCENTAYLRRMLQLAWFVFKVNAPMGNSQLLFFLRCRLCRSIF